MYTVQQIVSAVQRRLPDAPSQTCVLLTNLVHRELLADIPELRLDSLTQNLTSGTGEYNIAEPVFQVLEAYYQTAANTSSQLSPITIEGLNAMVPTWRTDATGTPLYFYLSSNQASANSEVIGLYPVPNTTTSAGYPILKMDISELESSDLTLTSTVFVTLQSPKVYIEGVSYMLAEEIRPQVANAYKAEYMGEIEKARSYVRTRNEMAKNPGIHNIRGASYADRTDVK